ncbi:NAD-dependent epimerase/dehydratase family protein [Phytopseudomonas seleniipraecipitans]|uniref:UDP-glucose 4-epimerase n=1 Tax=Phytopseudomonas seleniipraecipitans TaxID=640205 RepID=A0A1G7V003_9GAMM|nr:NAD-dependent epimerase/dehydratase family protein [Pseudomonas seleniipraecipitans]SDG53205.1 UDP-glucose 4-epimerase [Pseudomonas seleniipraecipitans]
MKVLLTGASGFIGSHISNALIEMYGKSAVLALASKKINNMNCLIYKAFNNFGLEEKCFNDITHVIHAGAFTPKDASQANDLDRSFDNICYTNKLLSYEFASLKRFVNLSSLDVYASAEQKLSEKSKIEPVSLYGSSKLYCEKMIKAFSEQRNITYMNLRIGHVYGPGEEKYKKVLPAAIRNILENKPLELWGDGSELRSFIFIEDVVESVLNSLESSEKNLDINVASGVAVSIRDLLNKIIEVSGQQVKINKKESSHEKRDLLFDNGLLLGTLLKKEIDLMEGLKIEYNYMKDKYENNI